MAKTNVNSATNARKKFQKDKVQAGEASNTPAAKPIDEAKVLQLIHRMAPQLKDKCPTLQDGVTVILAENDRLKRQVAELEKQGGGSATPGNGLGNIEAGIKRLEDSLKLVKENLSYVLQRTSQK